MKVEVDLDEAFKEFCTELRGRRWAPVKAGELAEKVDELLNCGPDYQVMAEAMKMVLDSNPTLKEYLDDLMVPE